MSNDNRTLTSGRASERASAEQKVIRLRPRSVVANQSLAMHGPFAYAALDHILMLVTSRRSRQSPLSTSRKAVRERALELSRARVKLSNGKESRLGHGTGCECMHLRGKRKVTNMLFKSLAQDAPVAIEGRSLARSQAFADP